MKFLEYWPEFSRQLQTRLVAGYKQYGDKSFEMPAMHDIKMIQEECLDICGWGLILWARLEAIKLKLGAEDDNNTGGA